MEKVFKVSGKEYVLGRLRNIYVKITKKAGVAQQGKTKYIKCKGEFVKLTTYIKGNAKPIAKAPAAVAIAATAAAAGKTVKISKRVSVIANISKIKDIRTRKLLEKTFKKNAKLYFIKDNNRWDGGGIGGMYRTPSDRGARRPSRERSTGRAATGRARERSTGRAATGRARERSTSLERDNRHYVMRNRDQPVNRRADGTNIDDLSIELHEQEHVMFEKICNLEYVFRDTIRIRPYIKFQQNMKMFIKFYWSYDNWVDRGTRQWFEMPLHFSNFTEIMTGDMSGHIHITSEMKELRTYNIDKADYLEENHHTGKTHTYLRAQNLHDLTHILRTHGMDIFSDWFYDGTIGSRNIFTTYFTTRDGRWTRHNDGSFVLGEEEQRGLCFSINNLSLILTDVFNIIGSGYLDKNKVYMSNGNITRSYILKRAYNRINYDYSQSQIEWVPYSDTVARLRPDASRRFGY